MEQTAGQLEFHIPTEFSCQRPAITQTHIHHETPLSQHPVSSLLPKPSAQPAIVGNAEDLRPLYEGLNCPAKLDDYLYEDRSVVGLHVVSFKDATVLTLNWIHAAFDATAKRAILDAWNLVMLGREDQIPTPVSYREDALKNLGTNPLSPHALADRKTSTLGMIRWALSNITDLFFRNQETRIICLPAGFVENLHAVAMKELVSSSPGPGEERPFVSEGDILTAWVARLAVSHLSQYPDRTVRRRTDMPPFLSGVDGSRSPFKTPSPPERSCNSIFPLTSRTSPTVPSSSTSLSRSKTSSGDR
jgi:hypothetical protein